MKDFVRGFVKDEDGMETIEMVIILVVLVALAFAFRKTLLNWFDAFSKDVPQVTPPEPPKS